MFVSEHIKTVAELAEVLAQSVLTHEKEADGDDDMTLAGQVAKSF